MREKWLLGELSSEARVAFERDVPLEERQQWQHDDRALREELFSVLPPNLLKARVNSQIERGVRSRSRRVFWTALPAVGVVVASALLLIRPEHPPREPSARNSQHVFSGGASERVKGLAPRVVIFRQLEHSAEELRNGSLVRAHDVLQVGYVAGGREFGVLLSIDGRGLVTLHAPRMPNGEATLGADARTQLLERAYELDDAPDFERFFFVTSRDALRVTQILNAAEELARDPKRAMREQLRLGANIEQSSILLRKPSTP